MATALNITLSNILATAAKRRASYVHFTVGSYPTLRIDDQLVELSDYDAITESFMNQVVSAFLDAEQLKELEENRAVTFMQQFADKFRFKINVFYQRESLAVSLKLIPNKIPALSQLNLPPAVEALPRKTSGLVVVAGSYGSGKSTTTAAVIDEINKTRRENIVTIERPLEYLFFNNRCLIEQREVGRDAHSFVDALRYLEEFDVDIIMIGTNHEPGVIPEALEFANSGKLVLLQMTTTSVVQTIEEIISHFSGDQQSRARSLLADGLLSVICQQLIPRIGGQLIPATEILVINDALRSLIREGRTHQIETILQSSRAEGMMTFDQSLAELVNDNRVLSDRALEYAHDPEHFRNLVRRS